MKKEWFLALACCLWGGGDAIAPRCVEAVEAEAVASSGVESWIVELEKRCAVAKKEYSPQYDRTTAEARRAAREAIVALETRLQERPNDRATRAFYAELQKCGLTGETVSPGAFRKGAIEMNRRVASCAPPNDELTTAVVVALQRYSEANARTLGALDKEKVALFEEERAYFGEICDYFVECLQKYLRENDLESLDSVSFALAELTYCQPESPAVEDIVAKARSCFEKPNFYMEIDAPTLASFVERPIAEDFDICENIRGTQARGAGRVNGDMVVKLRENGDKAELCLALSASVATRTIGSSRGVHVNADNFGRVRAEKTVFWSEKGLESKPSVAVGTMKTRVKGINSERLAPLGGLVIQTKVANEIPKTEQESAARMSARVATRLDEEAGGQIDEFNRRWARTRNASSPEKRAVRGVASRTDEERLYFSCLVGRASQLASPTEELAAWLREVDRRNAENEATASSDVAPLNDAPRSASVAKRYSGSVERGAEKRRGNVTLRAHQSAPNNVAFVALSGLLFEGGDMGEALLARFPGVDPKDATEFLERFRAEKAGNDALSSEKIIYRFAQDRPFSARFDGNKIVTRLRFDSFERDGQVWRDLEICFVYRVEQENGRFVFRRESIDAIPLRLDQSAPIPARFQGFRALVLRTLDDVVRDEYVVDDLPLVDWQTDETLGYLTPVSMEAKDGWFETEFTFRAEKEKK